MLAGFFCFIRELLEFLRVLIDSGDFSTTCKWRQRLIIYPFIIAPVAQLDRATDF